ncbi:MAG: hypothetical protein P8010_08645 [Desulfosarcinaceae bacterium]|jgi:hypothetical protein
MMNRTVRSRVRLGFLLLLFSMLACDSGSDGAGTRETDVETPIITNVYLIHRSAPEEVVDLPLDLDDPIPVVYVGEDLKYAVEFTDQDMDADVLHFTRYFPHTKATPFLGPEQIAITQEGIGATYTAPDWGFFGAFIGTWGLEFQIEDAQGHLSDSYKVYVEVKSPPPPDPADRGG